MRGSKLVFDYTASEPWLVSERMRDVFDGVIDDEESVGAAWDRMNNERSRQLREDPEFRAELRMIYDNAGVNLISPTLSSRRPGIDYAEGVRRDLARWQARFDSVDWLEKVTSPAEARAVAEQDDVGVVLNTQNLGDATRGDLDRVDELFDAGVRIFQLTYNKQNHLGTGCNDPAEGGLSTLGRDMVDRLNELGGVVDLSHCGRRTTLDTVAYSDAPVAYTHTSCRTISEHFRGKSDKEIEALADTDGYMGIVGLPWFLTPDRENWSLDPWYENLAYAAEILGTHRLGVGTDFPPPANVNFGEPFATYLKRQAITRGFPAEDMEQHRKFGAGVGEMKTYADWSVIRDGLVERYDDATVKGIAGENFVSFWKRVKTSRP